MICNVEIMIAGGDLYGTALARIFAAWDLHAVFFVFFHTSTFQLLDKPWSQVSSLLPLNSCLQFLSRIGLQ